MSTHSHLIRLLQPATEDRNPTWEALYIHHDGPDHLLLLQTHYTSEESVAALFARGSLSELHPTPAECVAYQDWEGYEEEAATWRYMGQPLDGAGTCDYVYLWEGGSWQPLRMDAPAPSTEAPWYERLQTAQALGLTPTRSYGTCLPAGVYVNVTLLAERVGFRWPLYLTERVWELIETIPAVVSFQDVRGRLADVLTMTRAAIVEATREDDGTDEVLVEVILFTADNAPERYDEDRVDFARHTVPLYLLVGRHTQVDPAFILMTLGEWAERAACEHAAG